jgi:hypothetical protein
MTQTAREWHAKLAEDFSQRVTSASALVSA